MTTSISGNVGNYSRLAAARGFAVLRLSAHGPRSILRVGPWQILSQRVSRQFLIGQWLSERLGQTFVIESLPGAATNISPPRRWCMHRQMVTRCSWSLLRMLST